MWHWQQKSWPRFSFDIEAISPLYERFSYLNGLLHGSTQSLDMPTVNADILAFEALKNAEIEGELLNHESLRSSIKHQLGLCANDKRIGLKEKGMAKLSIEAIQNTNSKLSHDLLCHWHLLICSSQWDLSCIGQYRHFNEDMEIVSGPIGKPKVHYVAPPAKNLMHEMNQFIDWFNTSDQHSLIHAGITHLYFLAIHPFEDGNGRIARSLSQMSLGLHTKQPQALLLSQAIETDKKKYYKELEKTNSTLDITNWLSYFANTIIDAQQLTLERINLTIKKARFFHQYQDRLNERQIKIIKKLFEAEPEGFYGGLSAKNYMTICKTTASTATRDLNELIQIGILTKHGERKATRYYLSSIS